MFAIVVHMAGDRLFELRRRTFDTPNFRGIEFIEVESKSIINHVPGNYLPFNYTINPYRGCSHACSYCTWGETPILMAGGRTKRMADVRAGDVVVGTERQGRYRRYVTTQVLDHWETVKPAYRVTLDDGTALVASGDHRFLSDRGWKYVSGGEREAGRRPHITSNNSLLGPGQIVGGPDFESAAIKNSPPRKVEAVEAMGVEMPMYDITTGTGDFIADGVISHNCFARSTHTFLGMDAGKDFETKIIVKVNAGELLRKELRKKSWTGEGIAMGTATDPYQRAEGRYQLMPKIIKELVEVGNPFSILTKGTLLLRDLDLLIQAAEVTSVSTAYSIGTLDEDVWRKSEPGTPHPRKRLDAVARLNAAGIPCGVLMAPVLPGISDSPEQMRAVVEGALDAGATNVSPILLHLRPKVKEVYMGWLEDNYPDLVPRYQATYGGSAYASRADRQAFGAEVGEIIRDADGVRRSPDPKPARFSKRSADSAARARRERADLASQQLTLI
ncbi:MAG: radical SAM protein [Actinomycetota bacterium]